jgi:hypothetical protein
VGSALFHPASSKPIAEQLKCISLSIKLAQLSTGVLIQHIEVRCFQNNETKIQLNSQKLTLTECMFGCRH